MISTPSVLWFYCGGQGTGTRAPWAAHGCSFSLRQILNACTFTFFCDVRLVFRDHLRICLKNLVGQGQLYTVKEHGCLRVPKYRARISPEKHVVVVEYLNNG